MTDATRESITEIAARGYPWTVTKYELEHVTKEVIEAAFDDQLPLTVALGY